MIRTIPCATCIQSDRDDRQVERRKIGVGDNTIVKGALRATGRIGKHMGVDTSIDKRVEKLSIL